MKKVILSFILILFSFGHLLSQFISEVDSDQTGSDTEEFVEIAGTPGASLTGYILVVINGGSAVNGSDDEVLRCHDLDGQTFDANGFFTIGNATGVNWTVTPSSGWLQNGPDAVALVQTASCPSIGTACTSIGGTIVSALVYDASTPSPDDTGLLSCVGETVQYSENQNGNGTTESLQFDGTTWFAAAPTMGAANMAGLPISLVSFDAKPMENEKAIKLVWATSSEEDNEYFSIEHSTDGITFREVGIQMGTGNSNVVSTYNFMHDDLAIGTHYYRLLQVDYDGVFDYSEVITATLRNNGTAISLFPNPTIDKVNIQVGKPFSKHSYFQLLNIQGQIVREHSLPQDVSSFDLEMSDFPTGVYYIQLRLDNELTTHKIIKQ